MYIVQLKPGTHVEFNFVASVHRALEKCNVILLISLACDVIRLR